MWEWPPTGGILQRWPTLVVAPSGRPVCAPRSVCHRATTRVAPIGANLSGSRAALPLPASGEREQKGRTHPYVSANEGRPYIILPAGARILNLINF